VIRHSLYSTLVIIVICGSSFAHGIFDSLPAIGAGTGVLNYYGLLSKTNNVSSLSSIRAGYSVFVEEEMNDYFNVSATLLGGKLANVENSQTTILNFQTNVVQADLSLVFHTDRLLPKSRVTPYAGIGIGFLAFNPYGDIYDSQGEKYYYWSDGSIRNQAQAPLGQNVNTAKILVLNYNFSTPLDPNHSYSHETMIVPLTLGFNFAILDNVNAKIGASYFYSLTSNLDNVKTSSGNDTYLYSYVSVSYRFKLFKKDTRPDNKRYDNVDFSQFDADFPAPDKDKKK